MCIFYTQYWNSNYTNLQYNYSLQGCWGFVLLNLSIYWKIKFKPFEAFLFLPTNNNFFAKSSEALGPESLNVWCHISNTISFSLISSSDSCWIILALFQCKIKYKLSIHVCIYVYTYIVYVCVYMYGFLADSFNMWSKLYFLNVNLAGANRMIPTAPAGKWSSFPSTDPVSVLQT